MYTKINDNRTHVPIQFGSIFQGCINHKPTIEPKIIKNYSVQAGSVCWFQKFYAHPQFICIYLHIYVGILISDEVYYVFAVVFKSPQVSVISIYGCKRVQWSRTQGISSSVCKTFQFQPYNFLKALFVLALEQNNGYILNSMVHLL